MASNFQVTLSKRFDVVAHTRHEALEKAKDEFLELKFGKNLTNIIEDMDFKVEEGL